MRNAKVTRRADATRARGLTLPKSWLPTSSSPCTTLLERAPSAAASLDSTAVPTLSRPRPTGRAPRAVRVMVGAGVRVAVFPFRAITCPSEAISTLRATFPGSGGADGPASRRSLRNRPPVPRVPWGAVAVALPPERGSFRRAAGESPICVWAAPAAGSADAAPESATSAGSAAGVAAEAGRTGAAGAGSGAVLDLGREAVPDWAGAGGEAGAAAGGGADGEAGDGKGAACRGGSRRSGSTYVSPSPTRIPRWTYAASCSGTPEGPGSATV
jgi:hypothetical protein